MLDHYEAARKCLDSCVKGFVSEMNYDNPNAYNYLTYSPMVAITHDSHIDKNIITNGAAILWSLYYIEDLEYYKNEDCLKKALQVFKEVYGAMYSDGTFDNYITNFHDPAHSGFVIEGAAEILEFCYNKMGNTPIELELKELTLDYVNKLAHAICNFGFHTPNHRWVQCAALSFAYKYLKCPEFLERINKFFAEGIDCDENGEYTERSAGNYSRICDCSFMMYSHFSNTTDKYEYVRRNLNLVLSYIEPDNTIMSLNSTRQDVGFNSNISIYYKEFLELAIIDENPYYAWMCDEIVRNNNGLSSTYLSYYMLANSPEYIEKMRRIDSKPIPKDRSRFLSESLIYRKYIPKWNATCSVIGGPLTPFFFKLQFGKHRVFGRIASSFFGEPHSKFRPQTLEENPDGSFTLTSVESQGYRTPLEEPQGTPYWRHMDHSKREWTNIQTLIRKTTFRFEEDEIVIDVSAEKTDNVPCKLEFVFVPEPNAFFLSDDIDIGLKAGYYIVGTHEFKVIYGISEPCISISGCKYEHRYAETMKGSEPYDGKTFVVASTFLSPSEHQVRIKFHKVPLHDWSKEN